MLAARNNTLPLVNHRTLLYTGELLVGTPAAQSFRLVFDTGSADLWLFAEDMQPALPYLRSFDANRSSSFERDDSAGKWHINYGLGWCAGRQAREDFTIAERTVRGVPFGLAVNYSVSVFARQEDPIDGILGLALPAANNLRCGGEPCPTLMELLRRQGLISRITFSFYLTDSPDEAGSQFILGEPDKRYAPKGITYMNIAHESMWYIEMDALYVAGSWLDLACGGHASTSRCFTLVDTGTSFIGIPHRLWHNFYSTLVEHRDDCHFYAIANVIRCLHNSYDGLPKVSLRFLNRQWTLRPQHYFIDKHIAFMRLPAPGSQQQQQQWQQPQHEEFGSGLKTDIFILGDTFIKTFYVVFDQEQRRIGFANPADMPILTLRILVALVSIAAAVIALAFAAVRYRHWQQDRLVSRQGHPLVDGMEMVPVGMDDYR
eukprot:TRINITY_DN67469_c5_g1_i1.p1 TRINITY_DN67469_c5_g1~~TRINITY_DN67469_c5_g1_i1.p1  ORF type:complete len:482 (+),score=205.48 TRINITY_DN67469_c5_g1_i1:154-1446(+)